MNNTNDSIKYVVYTRKSSESEDRQMQSIEDQITELTRISKMCNLVVVDQYSEAKSAKEPHIRPEFRKMIQAIERGEANGILVWHLNRLSRNPVESGELSWLLQTGVIKSIRTIDREHRSEDNVMLFSLESSSANQFIIDLRKSSKRGMVGKADRGWFPSRAGVGYLNNLLTNEIDVDEVRFPMVRQFWDLMLTGRYSVESIRVIANEKMGFTMPKTKRTGGGPVSKNTFYKMFRNIFYTGYFKWDGKIRHGNHKPMITMEEFQRVQNLLDRDHKPKNSKHEQPYSGLIACPCGASITTSVKHKMIKATGATKEFAYAHCTGRVSKDCTQPRLSRNDLEDQIIKKLEKVNILPEFLQWAFEAIEENAGQEAELKKTIHQNLHTTIIQKDNESKNLTRMRSRELISEEEFIAERTRLEQELIKLKASLDQKDDESKRKEDLKDKFRFLSQVKSDFVEHKEKRGLILSKIGEGHLLQGGVLDVKTHGWMTPVLTNYKTLENDLHRLELEENLSVDARNEQIRVIRLSWGG